MRASSTLFLKGQTPFCTTLIGSSKVYKGILHVKKHPIICFCNNIQTNSYEVANGSYIPTLQTEDKNNKEKLSRKLEAIGAFQKLPMVMPSIDIIGSALRKARRVSPTKGIINPAKREKNKGAKQLDALMKELAVPLRTYVENFPKKTYLHPYERSLIELTLGDGYYETVYKENCSAEISFWTSIAIVLGKVDALRKKLVSVGKEHASLCAKSSSKREAEERLNQGIQKVEYIFSQEGKVVDDLLGIAKTLRAMPVINLETPTLCLVGAPNVGKSSLVRVLSTGKPEVCNYPFTTRGILIGHIVLNYEKFQVTDTPGLLKRQYEDRNNLEKLTLAALSHLPSAILYVHDLSGECGTSPADQFTIYKEIRENFTEHLWLDVVSKSDLLGKAPVIYATEDADPEQLELLKYRKSGPDGALHVSVKTEQGLHELKSRVYELLNLQMAKINDRSKNQEK